MTMIASIRHPDQKATCSKCGDVLTIPEWSEFVSEGLVLNLWSCTKCGYRFETEADLSTDVESKDNAETIEAFFPSLLIA
jgi:Zn ribbon nucleic-acid-binding protein